ncbi:MAG TPA: hypothetical protein DCL44_04485 [Elusimicrobia bacterium]|nr:hypothetical protein [Elusimicrobiota bacterium]
MLIRRAIQEDLPALVEIELEHPSYPAWGVKGLQAEFSNRNAVTLLVEDAGKTAGFINFWIVRPEVQLNAVVVSKAGLRRGAASGLLAKMYEYAKKNDCFCVDLEVSAANLPAIKLYEKHGFSVVGRRPKFYNNSEDALLMRKALDNRAPGEKK